jgi:hypothetical protein
METKIGSAIESTRKDLLSVSGLGPKDALESCAGFYRITGSKEALMQPLVRTNLRGWPGGWHHLWLGGVQDAEGYSATKRKRATKWESTLKKASHKFGVSEELPAVIENLIDPLTCRSTLD